jgi:YVTN family beta-propeller protein
VGTAVVVAAGTLVERAVVPVGRGPIQLCSAADGALIVALASGGTTITVLDGQTAAVRSTIEVGPSPWNATARGARVYVAMHTDAPAECLDAVQVVDCEAARIVATIALATNSRPKILVPVFEQHRLYSLNSGNGTISEIDIDAHTVTNSVAVGGGPHYAQLWQGTLYVANGESNDVALVDEATLIVTNRIGVGHGPERCVVYKDHDQVYTNNLGDNTVSVVDLTARAESARIPVGRGPIRITPWAPRGRAEWAVLCRSSRDEPNGAITFLDSVTHQVTDSLHLAGPAANWNWGIGPHHQTVYVTLIDEPRLVVIDTHRLEVLDTLSLSTPPEPAGFGPGLLVSKSGGVFVASQDSVIFLTQA